MNFDTDGRERERERKEMAEIDERESERQRESLSPKPMSLGGIVLSCAFPRRLWLSPSLRSLPPSLRHSTTSHFTRKDRKCCKEQRTSRPPLRSTQFPICRVPLSSSNKSSVLPPKSQSCGSSLSYCRRRILVIGTWDMTKESSWPAHICRLQGVKMRCSSG